MNSKIEKISGSIEKKSKFIKFVRYTFAPVLWIIEKTNKISEEFMTDIEYDNKIKKNIVLKAISSIISFIIAFVLAWFILQYELDKNDKDFEITLEKFQEVGISLKEVEQSLSTKYIGIFPSYLDEINKLLMESLEPQNDISRIVIFKDVLFYGAFWNGKAFKKMIQLLVELSNKPENEIIIAYYDNSRNWRDGRMFREVVQESWMRKEDLSKLAIEINEIAESLRRENSERRDNNFTHLYKADSIASQKYFAIYRDSVRNEFLERRKNILAPIYDPSQRDDWLFKQIDDIINTFMNKPEDMISYYDIYTMYHQVTEELKSFFAKNHIRTIPLNNYLSMSCWSNGKKALFALPGRFAADEIGFISHDLAILGYIEDMLNGVDGESKIQNE